MTSVENQNITASENLNMDLIKQNGMKIAANLAGYVSIRTMEMGLRLGLFEEIAKHLEGVTAVDLAEIKNIDPIYTKVWCDSAYGSELLDKNDSKGYIISSELQALLLDENFPGWVGGLPAVFLQPEMFDNFAKNIITRDRTWWDKCSSDWINSVGKTARPMYTRLIPGGINQIPGLSDKLMAGARVLELATGAGAGIIRMAQTYPNCNFVGIDGDAYSLEVTDEKLKDLNLDGKITTKQSMFEDIDFNNEFELVVINATMHECRDIEKVTSKVFKSLTQGGQFVISDFPFPDTDEGLKTVPGRIMSGIQFFESQIDDLLLPTKYYVDLLNKHGFTEVGAFDLNPTHMVVHGKKP